MTLKLNGKPVVFDGLMPGTRKVIAVLEKCKDGEYFTTNEVARMAHISVSSLRTHAKPAIKYRHQVGQQMWYGNPRSIAALRKKLNQPA